MSIPIVSRPLASIPWRLSCACPPLLPIVRRPLASIPSRVSCASRRRHPHAPAAPARAWLGLGLGAGAGAGAGFGAGSGLGSGLGLGLGLEWRYALVRHARRHVEVDGDAGALRRVQPQPVRALLLVEVAAVYGDVATLEQRVLVRVRARVRARVRSMATWLPSGSASWVRVRAAFGDGSLCSQRDDPDGLSVV